MTAITRAPTGRPRRFVALLMALPAVGVAFWMMAIEGWRWYQPRSSLYTAPFAYSLAEAIALDEAHRAYEFVRAGQDPNQPIAVRHPVLTKGRGVLVSPLVWAVALQREQIALMLLGFGARLDGEPGQSAACLAERLDNTRLATLLRQHGAGASPQPCPMAHGDDQAILAFLAEPQ